MTVYTLDVLASTAVLTRSHARNKAEGRDFFFGWQIGMKMRAACVIRAFVSEKVDVTHLDLLDPIYFGFIVIFTRGVDALTATIACNDFFTVGWHVCRRLGR